MGMAETQPHAIVLLYMEEGGEMIIDKTLPSSWRRIQLSETCWAQLPPSWIGEIIPDEFIFNPAWNRDKINLWWKEAMKVGK